MATDRLTAQVTWDASARITASGDTAIEITNTTSRVLYYALTADDTPPAFAAALGHTIHPNGSTKENKSFQLKDGERLWLAIDAPAGTFTYTAAVA